MKTKKHETSQALTQFLYVSVKMTLANVYVMTIATNVRQILILTTFCLSKYDINNIKSVKNATSQQNCPSINDINTRPLQNVNMFYENRRCNDISIILMHF